MNAYYVSNLGDGQLRYPCKYMVILINTNNKTFIGQKGFRWNCEQSAEFLEGYYI